MSSLYALLNKLAYEELSNLGIPNSILKGVYATHTKLFEDGLTEYVDFYKKEDGNEVFYIVRSLKIRISEDVLSSVFYSLVVLFHELCHVNTIWENGMRVKEKRNLKDEILDVFTEVKCDVYGYFKALLNYRKALSVLRNEKAKQVLSEPVYQVQ